MTRGNDTQTGYTYDPISRLAQLTQTLANSADNLTLGFSYNPASQIATRTASNDAYAYTGQVAGATAYGVNGLNQTTTVGAGSLGYDARGNLNATGAVTYGYNSKNQLASASGPTATTIYYDPLGLIDQIWGSGTEFDNALGRVSTEWVNGSLARRYVYGPGSDEPLVWYEGAGTSDRRWLHADERGSVIAVTDASGNALAKNSYDEYGVPGVANLGRFQYTGQKWLPELGLYDYKARMYSSRLGRFLQTDPIGYGDGMNWYNYVGSDPVNFTDPKGLFCSGTQATTGLPSGNTDPCFNADSNPDLSDILVQARRVAGIILGSTGSFNDDAVSHTSGSSSASTQNTHRYVVNRDSQCSASSVFNKFKQPGVSAPGAPAAREGFTPRVSLAGGNTISQYVNSSTRTIVNTTIPPHIFYPGTVTISVTPNVGGGSHIQIIGTGSGSYAEFNDVAGELIFGQAAAAAGDGCGSTSYTPVRGG